MAQTSGNGPLGWCGIRASRPTAEAGSNSLQCCLIATPSTFGLLRTELGIDWPAPVRLKFQVSISGDGHDCGITVVTVMTVESQSACVPAGMLCKITRPFG